MIESKYIESSEAFGIKIEPRKKAPRIKLPINEELTSEEPDKRAASPFSYGMGDLIFHEVFGLGTVLLQSGSGDLAEITVDFLTVGKTRLLLRYAPIKKIPRK